MIASTNVNDVYEDLKKVEKANITVNRASALNHLINNHERISKAQKNSVASEHAKFDEQVANGIEPTDLKSNLDKSELSMNELNGFYDDNDAAEKLNQIPRDQVFVANRDADTSKWVSSDPKKMCEY